MADSWEELFRELDADRALVYQAAEDDLARGIIEKVDADVLSALGVPEEILYERPATAKHLDPEPAVMGAVYWAFGKACPWYVDNDPQLKGRVAIETTGRVLLQFRAEPS